MRRLFIKPSPLILTFVSAFAILFIALGITIYSFRNVNDLLIIHFDNFHGLDFLGTKTNVFEIVSIGAFLVLMNAGLAKALYHRERFFSNILGSVSVLIAGLILIAVGVIVSVNL